MKKEMVVLGFHPRSKKGEVFSHQNKNNQDLVDINHMKTYFTFKNLHHAYLDCRRRKTNSIHCLKFTENLERNLLNLEDQLQNRAYKISQSTAFIVQKPKIREIFAANFTDRVVHHLLYNYLSPIFEKRFIYDSWACREGKGTHRAALRLKKFLCEIEREREREREAQAPRHFISRWILKAFSLASIRTSCMD
jgi:hypothetical protein